MDLIRELKQAKGRGEGFNPDKLHEKIETIGLNIGLDELTRSIDVEIVDRLGLGWDEWYGLLEKYFKREGHTQVSIGHIERDLKIGVWVSHQRLNRDTLSEERINRLNSLAFSWNPHAEAWELGFSALATYYKREGHIRVPDGHIESGVGLANWVYLQRSLKDKLTPDQFSRLDALGFSWNPRSEAWDMGYASLKNFHSQKGHADVPSTHIAGGFSLGRWMVKQRSKRTNLTKEQIAKLESLGFNWSPNNDSWEGGFKALTDYFQREGHTRVPVSHIEGYIKLGVWSHNQRSKRQSLTIDKIARLESVGFSWGILDELWDVYYSALEMYFKREGHTRVHVDHFEGALNLGYWVTTQRAKRDRLSEDRLSRLNTLSFSWDPLTEIWDEYFATLVAYKNREGHTYVPQKHIENGIKLGQWVQVRRQRKDKINEDQISRLDSIGFIWDPHAEAWEAGFSALVSFYKREGHIGVHSRHLEGEFKLGMWVLVQRRNKSKMADDRLRRLDKLDFIWRAR